MQKKSILRVLPDVAADAHSGIAGELDWVGMSEIEMPILVQSQNGTVMQVPARISAYVNLHQKDVRGIHMSRLYLQLEQLMGTETLSPVSLRHLLGSFLESHQGLSDRAMVKISYDYLVRRPALASDNEGWKCYPVSITGILGKGCFSTEVACDVDYSSTCPCSAALARQLIQERFKRDFTGVEDVSAADVVAWLGTEDGICATPHSQRSTAQIRVRLRDDVVCFRLLDIIDRVENSLKTPVQTAVKREDEQAFARLNGENLMFCEDAGRRLQSALDKDERIVDFWVMATHYESLHAHNAVSVVTKGVEGGYKAAADTPTRFSVTP